MKVNYEEDDEEESLSGIFNKRRKKHNKNLKGIRHKNIKNLNYKKEIQNIKIYIYFFITIIILILFFIIIKKFILSQKTHVIEVNNENNISNNVFKIKVVDNSTIHFLNQKISNIDLNSFSSLQLRNPKNIKLINELKITLSIEYEKFVHLKIKDAEKKRWEIPIQEILNKDYLNNVDNNTIFLSTNSKYLNSKDFFIEFLPNNSRQINEFSFRLMSKEREQFYLFNTSQNFIFSDNYINFQSELTSDYIYGFGERTHNFQLGQGLYTIWTQDSIGTSYDKGIGGGNQYSHQPIALHKTKYQNLWLGFVFLNTNDQDVKISKIHEVNYLEHKTIGGIIDYYIIVDRSPEEVLKNIQFLIGIPTLPPFWALGNHQSRYGYNNFGEFKNIYELYKRYEIPIDTMWIDIDAMKDYEIFTVNDKFEQIGQYIKNVIHQDGNKFIPIVDLGLYYENQNSTMVKLGNELDIFIKSNYTKKTLIGKVWQGKAVFPDFMNPNITQFWNTGLGLYHDLVNFDGIWLDMNEPSNILDNLNCKTELAKTVECTKDKNIYDIDNLAYIPGYNQYNRDIGETLSKRGISENALVYGNFPIYDVKPLIAFFEGKITYDYLYNNLKIRPFILSRSTTLGSGKYVFHWLGDNHSQESDIKNSISGIFNFNIFGIPFTGDDICGFLENSSKELCIRWYNLGAFYPFMRNHNKKSARDQFPWSFDNNNNEKYNAVRLIRNVINLRYSLLRYMYSQLFLISINQKGSFFKPIMFEFPEDVNSYEDIESKIMIGEALLLCAFYKVKENDKEFILPNLDFNRYPSGESIKTEKVNNNKINLSGKLDEIHLFLREGFIISKQNTFEKYILNTMKLREEKIDLIINVDDNKKSRGVLFFDNDDKDTIKDKTYYRVDLSFVDNKLEVVTNKNNLKKYNFNDHILGNIELWNVNKVFDVKEKENKKYNLKIKYKIDLNKNENIEGIYYENYNKIIYNLSQKSNGVSLFDIENIFFDS